MFNVWVGLSRSWISNTIKNKIRSSGEWLSIHTSSALQFPTYMSWTKAFQEMQEKLKMEKPHNKKESSRINNVYFFSLLFSLPLPLSTLFAGNGLTASQRKFRPWIWYPNAHSKRDKPRHLYQENRPPHSYHHITSQIHTVQHHIILKKPQLNRCYEKEFHLIQQKTQCIHGNEWQWLCTLFNRLTKKRMQNTCQCERISIYFSVFLNL
jgi:hypothetical protein